MIRIFQHGDHVAIAEIYSNAIHEIACEYYSPQQCLAWASRQANCEHWKNRCELKRPFVAVVESEIAAFLELDPDGHIDCAYVNPRFKRRGIVTALVKHAVDVCFAFKLNRVYVEASLCAKPLFEKLGFNVVEENRVRIGEVELLNYKMELLKASANRSPQPISRTAG
ncbi:MAG TPA: GNAT family N-acetyltransferase [Pirellulales bacterium]|nr:GNAT family N-acetyltransferase [Pirellulales bacterium]